MNYMGLPIVIDINMTLPAEDWSRVRSPSRAIRRLRRGFRQNIRHYRKPNPDVLMFDGKMICHPVTLHALQQRMQAASAFH